MSEPKEACDIESKITYGKNRICITADDKIDVYLIKTPEGYVIDVFDHNGNGDFINTMMVWNEV